MACACGWVIHRGASGMGEIEPLHEHVSQPAKPDPVQYAEEAGGATALRRVTLSLVFLVLGIITSVLYTALLKPPDVHPASGPDVPSPVASVSASPGGPSSFLSWLGKDKESKDIRKRYVDVRDYFESLVREKDEEEERQGRAGAGNKWQLLSSSQDGKLRVWMRWPDPSPTAPGASVLVGNGSLPGVPLVLSEGRYDGVPAVQLWDAMRTRNLARTQPLLDPFFEAYRTVKTFKDDPSIELGVRSTKRLLVYGKRDFAFACVEEQQQQGGGSGSRGYVTAVLSLPQHPLLPETAGYTRAYQDMVGLYTDNHPKEGEGGSSSRAVLVMRTDLRGNIPLWLFTKSCGHTGLHVLQTLQRMTAP